MKKILYRHNQSLGATPTDALSVLTFETRELGNTDVLEYCLEHYNFPSTSGSLIEGLIRHINGDEGITVSEDGYPFILDIMLDHIRKETGVNVKHVLWLASKQSVIDNYEGTEDNIEAYETSPVILSDLGEDGILFGYAEAPKPCADTAIERITVKLYKRPYTLFRFTAFPGTPKQQTVTVAEYKLNALIERRIEQERYPEVREVDEMYSYFLPKEIDVNDDREIRESIEDVID